MEYKGFDIKTHNGNPRLFQVVHHGKAGKIPTNLQGLFTDRGTAMKAIDIYVDSKGA